MTPGIIEVNNTFRGVLRDESGSIAWECNHIHSKAELNVRWSKSDYYPWEYSAKNCAEIAKAQREDRRAGNHGVIASTDQPLESRDDAKFVKINDYSFVGKLELASDGRRWIRVSCEDIGTGYLNVDDINKSIVPSTKTNDLKRIWAVAALYLKKSIWGTKFRNPNETDTVEASSIPSPQVNLLLSSPPVAQITHSSGVPDADEVPEEEVFGMAPHIRVADDTHKTYYEVIDRKGEVAGKYVHRGEAAKKLQRVKNK